MKKENKNSKKKITKENLFIKQNIGMVLIILIVIILITVAVIISLNSSDEADTKDNTEEEIYSTEETVEEEYGFSEEDAINVVSGIFNSDNYTFDASLGEDNMYIVTVTNTETDDVYTFIVDPNDGSYEMKLDIDE